MDVRVLPLSRQNIREMTVNLRAKVGLRNVCYFPAIEFLELGMVRFFPDFNYEYLDRKEMGNDEGLTVPEEHKIKIRLDVLEAAYQGNGRARFTIFHEIGHYFLHLNQPPCLARNMSIPPYERSEWQANVWAAELLMPAHIVKGMRIDEIIQECQVSREAANYHLSKIR